MADYHNFRSLLAAIADRDYLLVFAVCLRKRGGELRVMSLAQAHTHAPANTFEASRLNSHEWTTLLFLVPQIFAQIKSKYKQMCQLPPYLKALLYI